MCFLLLHFVISTFFISAILSALLITAFFLFSFKKPHLQEKFLFLSELLSPPPITLEEQDLSCLTLDHGETSSIGFRREKLSTKSQKSN